MIGKYHKLIDAKIAELLKKHHDDEAAVTKELTEWFGENTEIFAGRAIENWIVEHAPKWTPEGGLVVDDDTVIQVSENRCVEWKYAKPEDKAAWIKRAQAEGTSR
jgi:hypothetical protein